MPSLLLLKTQALGTTCEGEPPSYSLVRSQLTPYSRLLKQGQLPLLTVESLCEEWAPLDTPDNIQSSHALDILAEICATKEGGKEKATQAFDLLAKKYDPIRKNYWSHRKLALGFVSA